MRAKLLLALGSTALTLLVMEVFLARFLPQKTIDHVLSNRAGMYRVSNFTLTELIPNFDGREREADFDVAVRINSLGYRNAEFAPVKDSQLRILAVGDSFTFGHGVEAEQAYPQVLQRELRDRGRPRVEVINDGVPARWVDEYYLELKHRGLALQPDLVLVGFFIGNDIDGTDAKTHVWPEVDERGRPLRVDVPSERLEDGFRVQRSRKARWKLPIIRSSHVAQLLFDAGKSLGDLLRPNQAKDVAIYEPEYDPRVREVVDRVQAMWLAMAELCRERNVPLVVVMMPTREQVEPAARRGLEHLDFDKPQRLFAEFFRAHGIAFIDLLPHMRAESTPVYLPIDSHWNVVGHALTARVIADELLQRGLVPKAPDAG